MTFELSNTVSVETFVSNVCSLSEKEDAYYFFIRNNRSGKIIGGSGYWYIDQRFRRLEIGGSWITPAKQKSSANTEAKFLLLSYAFEKMNYNRVGFSIDSRNKKSLMAIERIGAKKEGVLRNNLILHDGQIIDSIVFSIIRNEWPVIKDHIQSLLIKYR